MTPFSLSGESEGVGSEVIPVIPLPLVGTVLVLLGSFENEILSNV